MPADGMGKEEYGGSRSETVIWRERGIEREGKGERERE